MVLLGRREPLRLGGVVAEEQRGRVYRLLWVGVCDRFLSGVAFWAK